MTWEQAIGVFVTAAGLGAFWYGHYVGRREVRKLTEKERLENLQDGFTAGANWLAAPKCRCPCGNAHDGEKCGMRQAWDALREQIRRQHNIEAGEEWRNN